ncbi:unnamed protein product [Parajaminaea phylloscopi]
MRGYEMDADNLSGPFSVNLRFRGLWLSIHARIPARVTGTKRGISRKPPASRMTVAEVPEATADSAQAARARFARATVPKLTTISHTSALVFSTFLVVHLSAPLASVFKVAANSILGSDEPGHGRALLAGSNDAASKWMLLGRVYYQGALTEPLIVWGSLAVHVSASIAKRCLKIWLKRQSRQRLPDCAQISSHRPGPGALRTNATKSNHGAVSAEESKSAQAPQSSSADQNASDSCPSPTKGRQDRAAKRSFSPSSLHALSGYLILPALLPHVLLTRIFPSSSQPPISELSPSELDYSIISVGLSSQISSSATSAGRYRAILTRIASWTVLTCLVVTAVWHSTGGLQIISRGARARAAARRARTSQSSNRTHQPTTSPPTQPDLSHAGRTTAKEPVRGNAVTASRLIVTPLILVGAAFMALEPLVLSQWTHRRLHTVYAKVWPWSWIV